MVRGRAMLLKTETIWMIVGIAGSVYFVVTIDLFIYCKIRTCCHKIHQKGSTEFITDNSSRYPKLDKEEEIRKSDVCEEQDLTLQRYVQDPTKENTHKAKESDEQGEPKYDYATRVEISRDTGETSKISQKERHGNESNVYESVHVVSDKMIAVEIDIKEYKVDCIAISAEDISDNMSHKKLITDREHGSEQGDGSLPTNTNQIEKRGDGDRLDNMDSYSIRESQGSGQSNDRRISDESGESNNSNISRSSDKSVHSDNTPRESTSSTNLSQDIKATNVNIYAKNLYIGPNNTRIVNMNK